MKTHWVITTTQNAFHVMRGHVADGTIVMLPGGDRLEIIAGMKGWQLINGRGEIVVESNNAFVIQDAVLTYGQ